MFGYVFLMPYHLISCCLLLKLIVICNPGFKVGGLSSLSYQKVMEIPPKKKIADCYYHAMVSPIYDEGYDKG